MMNSKDCIISTLKGQKPELLKYGVRNIGLFGSYSRQEQSDTSDVDILVDFDPGHETFDNLMAIYDLLEKSFNNVKIDVVTKNGLSPHIGPKILSEVLYV